MDKPTTMDYILGYTSGTLYPFEDKEKCLTNIIRYMLDRTRSMFKYEGLPDTIPERILELYLQTNGHCAFYKYNGDLYVFTGGLGGEPDVYYMPTIYTISNPALKLSVNAKIDEDCVVMPNDTMYMGLLPLLNRYGTQLVENELSLHIADINARIISIMSAADDRTRASAEQYLERIKEGKLGVIGDSKFLEGIKAQPFATTGNRVLTDLIEYEQYIKASLFNELGLNANYNMKREAINSGESQLNDDMLLPFIDDMLKTRKTALEKVNQIFGTDISVSLASSWEDNQQELDAQHELIEDMNDPEPEPDGEKDEPKPDEEKGGDDNE